MDCCHKQAMAARKACTDACFAPYKKCFEAAEKKCREMSPVGDPHIEQLCLTQELDKCGTGGSMCAAQCSPDPLIPGGCYKKPPPPQTCPYDCQTWNPQAQKCVGAPRNGCRH
jgi:hypothetical protein